MTSKKQVSDQKTPSLTAHYRQLAQEGRIKDDPAQRNVLLLLETLSVRLAPPAKGLTSFFKKPRTGAQSLYIWGNVGRGKSMLMDLFFEHVLVTRRRRVHFHAFMQEVHARIHRLRQEGKGDPVAVLAQQIAGETTLLCFDELQANDVADATLLYRLFEGLFAGGVTIVSTSNHPPASLYTGGVQRERFAKFIRLIEERMQIVALSSPLDYRHLQLRNLRKTYFYPLGAEADQFIADALSHICNDPQPRQETLAVQGRIITFRLYNHSIGFFTFSELCETALGPADYLALAERLDTMILTNIPRLDAAKRNEAKRLVTLVDALYEHKVRLLITADAPPEQLYSEGDGAFEFQRTASRLVEMQSAKWIEDD